MKNTWISRIGNRGARPDEVAPAEPHDELVSFAQHHFASDFPNPDRRECPTAKFLIDSINEGQFAGEELRAHLLSCSECFRDYRFELTKNRDFEVVVVNSKWNWLLEIVKQRPVQVFVGLIALLVISGSFLFLRHRDPGSTKARLSKQNPSLPGSTRVDPEPTQQPIETKTRPEQLGIALKRTPGIKKHDPREFVAVNKVSIDLEGYNLSRNAVQTANPPIALAAALNEVAITLPSGGHHGWYKVSLNDPFGKQIRPPVESTYSGTTLRAKLNLSSVRPGNYLLCITRNAEVPDCLLAIVKAH